MAAALKLVRNHQPPAGPPAVEKHSEAMWAKPMPRTKRRANYIPAQSFLQYNWIDKDPDLEFCLHAIEESGWTLEQIELATDNYGHKVSRWTLLGWFYKGVRRPHNSTLSTVMAVIGWDRPWVQRG